MDLKTYIAQSPTGIPSESPQQAGARVAGLSTGVNALAQWAQEANAAQAEMEAMNGLVTAQSEINEWMGSLAGERWGMVDGEQVDRADPQSNGLMREYNARTKEITESVMEGVSSRRARQALRGRLGQYFAQNALQVSKAQRALQLDAIRATSEDTVNKQIESGNYDGAIFTVKEMHNAGIITAEDRDIRIDALNKERDMDTIVSEYNAALQTRDHRRAAALQMSLANPEKYQHLSAEERMQMADSVYAMSQRIETETKKDQQEVWDKNYAGVVATIESRTIPELLKMQEDGDLSPDQVVSGAALIRAGSTATTDPVFDRDISVRIAMGMSSPNVRQTQENLKKMLIANAENLTPSTFQTRWSQVEEMDDERLQDDRYQSILDQYAGHLKVVRRGNYLGVGSSSVARQQAQRQEAFARFERDLREVYLETNSYRKAQEWATNNWQSYDPEKSRGPDPWEDGSLPKDMAEANQWLQMGWDVAAYNDFVERYEGRTP